MQHYTSWFSMNFPIYGLDLCCENFEDSKNVRISHTFPLNIKNVMDFPIFFPLEHDIFPFFQAECWIQRTSFPVSWRLSRWPSRICPRRRCNNCRWAESWGLGKLGEWLVPNISWEHRWGYIYICIYVYIYIYIHIKSHKCRWKNIIYPNCRCLLCTFVHVCYCWEMMIQLGGDFQLMLARFLLPLPSSLWDPDIDCFMSWVLPSQMLPSAQLLNWNASSYRHVWFVICLNGFQTTCFFLESMVLAPIFFRFPAIFPRNPLTPHGTSVSSLGEKKSWWDPGRFEADHEAEVEGDFGLVLFDSSIDSSTSSIPTPWHICLAGRFQGRGPGGVSLSEFHVRWPQDLAGKVTGFFDVLCEEGPSNRGVLSATT